jgi:hypothetical protein
MNDDRPVRSLPPLPPEAEDLYQRQLATCGEETMLEAGYPVAGEWTIRVCPECYSLTGELGGGRSGCGIHSIRDYDFIRVSVKTVEEHKAVDTPVVPEETATIGARERLSSLAV